jgi:hypothetical protein
MTGLRGDEFKEYFDKIPHVSAQFVGVFALNKFPKFIPVRNFFVGNLSKSDSPGSHWVIVCRPDKNSLEVFNSLGYESLESLLPYFKFKKSFKLHYNIQEFQSNDSSTCGLFCIYFIIYRILNFDLNFENLIEDIFDVDVPINEIKVSTFCEKLKLDGDVNLFL